MGLRERFAELKVSAAERRSTRKAARKAKVAERREWNDLKKKTRKEAFRAAELKAIKKKAQTEGRKRGEAGGIFGRVLGGLGSSLDGPLDVSKRQDDGFSRMFGGLGTLDDSLGRPQSAYDDWFGTNEFKPRRTTSRGRRQLTRGLGHDDPLDWIVGPKAGPPRKVRKDEDPIDWML